MLAALALFCCLAGGLFGFLPAVHAAPADAGLADTSLAGAARAHVIVANAAPAHAAPAHAARVGPEQAPAQALAVTLRKTVGIQPGVCAPGESVVVAPGDTVYYCYTLTNTLSSTVAIEPLDLIDNFGTSEFQPVPWVKPPGFLLAPGETLTPTVENGLIRPAVVNTSQNTAAGWGVAAADGSGQQQVLSNATTVNVVTLGMTAALGVSTAAGATPANCTTPAITLFSYASQAFFCVTLTNSSSITLTQHTISIPGFGIRDRTINKVLGPSGTTSATLRITNADIPALATVLTAPTVSSRAYVTSTTDSGLSVSAATEPVVVSGPAAAVSLLKTVNTDPVSCSTTTALNNVPFGQQFYYCVVLINPSVVTFTNHILTEPQTNINAAFNLNLAPNARISVTANVLTGTLGLTSFLGPFEARTIINSTMTYTASNPALGYRAVASAGAQVNIITPTPTLTRGPTATNTPIPLATLSPTPSLTPIPPTLTPTWTWTPSPTSTPPPTVLAFSTPSGLAPTPYPPIPGIQSSAPGSPFTSPLDPFAATATAQALGFAFPTPIIDPVGATLTAQAVGFPTPILDPFGATLTAQAQFAFPTPIIDPFGATLTAQAQFGFPTPILDPFGATLTAQAQFGFPTPIVDPFGATLTAQAVSPLATPVPPTELPPATAPDAGLVITVTATPTPEAAALLPTGPTQRPIEPPAAPPPADRRAFFAQVLDSAGTTLALLWFLGGSALFFVTAGVLAGLAFRDKERARYELDATGDAAAFTPQPPDAPAAAAKAGDDWPESLP
jgi:hypothetical protein